jgi:SPP1 family phage portal protein
MINIKNILNRGAASVMSDRDIILNEYNEFSGSSQRSWMLVGSRYYSGDNDISGSSSEGSKLAHPFMKTLVDEKISYLLSKPYSLTSDNDKFLEAVKTSLGKHFGYLLSRIGYESSNKGIAWVQPYIDNGGKFRLRLVPAEQCCPIWTDNSHSELSAMLCTYNVVTYEGRTRKDKTCIEYWTPTGLELYEVRDGKLFEDIEAYARYGVEGGVVGHYVKNGQQMSWGAVPFVAFKNNMNELPDIKFVKSLIDSYDASRSEVAAFLADVRNLIYVLRGYGGTDLAEFMRDLKRYRAIKIDDPSDGGVDTINPQMDISAAAQHYERLSEDIERFAQGLPKDIEKLGSNPSGVALKFFYSPLDLKCAAMESEFRFGFESLMYFVKVYLNESGKGNYADSDIDIVFNKDIMINELNTIEALEKSAGMLSKKTLLSQHPWVSDVEKEMELLNEEKTSI